MPPNPRCKAAGKTNLFLDLEDLPPVDVGFLSHHYGDKSDQHVESQLRRDLPFIGTSWAK